MLVNAAGISSLEQRFFSEEANDWRGAGRRLCDFTAQY